jgi:hypothetical protein
MASASSASFVPPIFGNFGKSAADLFKKKFDEKKDFKNIVQTKYKTASGLVFTTGGEFDSKNNLTGNLKLNHKKESYGEVEASVSTAGPMKCELKLKKLTKGFTLILTGDTKPKDFPAPTIKVAAEWQQDFLAAAGSIESSLFDDNVLVGSAVIGFEGLSVGGEVKLGKKKDSDNIADLKDYNVGAQYDAGDYTATLKTSEEGNNLEGSYIHKVNSDLSVAGKFNTKLDVDSPDSSLGLATEYKVDANTTLKLRGDTKKVVAAAVEHRLTNPKVQIGVASSWGIVGFSVPNPKDFGLSLTFGDYDA